MALAGFVNDGQGFSDPSHLASPLARHVFLEAWACGAVRVAILSGCSCSTANFLRAACWETRSGAYDGQGRLLVASASLPINFSAVSILRHLSPHLLRRLRLRTAPGDDMLNALMVLRSELCELRDVSIHFAARSLPCFAARRPGHRSAGHSVLARALARALPPSIVNLAADLRGDGGVLAGDVALADFSGAIPRGLVRLRLDLNKCSPQEIRSVAHVLPETLHELELLFHCRRQSWLAEPIIGDDGLEVLATRLPSLLERLVLKVECTDAGAGALCAAVPTSIKELHLDLRVLMLSPGGTPHCLPQGLASAMCCPRLLSLHLRLLGWALNASSTKVVFSAIPNTLHDLRLDFAIRNVGDSGVDVLTESLPLSLSQLALCLRGWRLSDSGVESLANGLAVKGAHLFCFMLLLPSTRVGERGGRALSDMALRQMKLLNTCGIAGCLDAEGEEAIQPLVSHWCEKPGSWVRFSKSETIPSRHSSSDDSPDWCDWDAWSDMPSLRT